MQSSAHKNKWLIIYFVLLLDVSAIHCKAQILPVLSSSSQWNNDRTRPVDRWVIAMLVAKIVFQYPQQCSGQKKTVFFFSFTVADVRELVILALSILVRVNFITKNIIIGSCGDDVSLTKTKRRGSSTGVSHFCYLTKMLSCLFTNNDTMKCLTHARILIEEGLS